MREGGLLLSEYKEYDERKFDPMAFNGLRTSSLFVYSGAFPVGPEGFTRIAQVKQHHMGWRFSSTKGIWGHRQFGIGRDRL